MRDHYAPTIEGYFRHWLSAPARALVRQGRTSDAAATLAAEVVAGIHGALVLTRALGDERCFAEILAA